MIEFLSIVSRRGDNAYVGEMENLHGVVPVSDTIDVISGPSGGDRVYFKTDTWRCVNGNYSDSDLPGIRVIVLPPNSGFYIDFVANLSTYSISNINLRGNTK